MKTQNVEIDGRTFTVRELSLREGMKFMNVKDNEVDIASLLELSVSIDGQPVKPGDLTLGEGIVLLPTVMRINRLSGEAQSGNG